MKEPAKANGADTAELLRKQGSRVVTHGGMRFKIGRVLPSQLNAAGFNGPIIDVFDQETPEDKRKELLEANKDKYLAMKEATVTAGLIEPKVWTGPDNRCPKGSVMLYDLAQVIDALFWDILAHTGLTPEAAEAARFRDSEPASEGDVRASQGGGEVAERGTEPAAR